MRRFPALALATMAALLASSTPTRASVLAFREVQRNLVNGVDGLNDPQGVAVSPDGTHVYVASEFDDALLIFSRDASTGALTQTGILRDEVNGIDGLDGARAVALSADGAYAYVAGFVDDEVAVFSRDASTGALTLLQIMQDGTSGVNGINGAGSIAISPDGASLYVAGSEDNAIAVFSRAAVAGTLAFVQYVKDATILGNARSVTVSPDGHHVYAAASGSDSLVVFARDAASGALTQVEVLKDNTNGVDGLDSARAVTISADGGQVYVAGQTDSAVSVFSRDATTGTLTFQQMIQDGAVLGNVTADGLNGTYGVLVSPDGKRVYAISNIDDGLVVFDRDPATGLLTYLEAYLDNVRGVNGLDGSSKSMQGFAISPDGRSIYAAGYAEDAVAVFDMTCGDGVAQMNEQCDDGNTQNGDCCSSSCRFDLAGSACAPDDNGCTDDQCNAGGVCEHVPNTAPCDDGLFCTVNDTCQAGACQGAARDCSPIADQCNDGVCDEAVDTCITQVKPDGSACDDGDLCSQTDACQAGACTGATPVVCVALDPCHDAGTCDPQTGLCADPAKADGSACDDGSLCTRADSCQAGSCTGTDPVVCTALDQCHDAGTCDPHTGVCADPGKADGATCDDNDACTTADSCQAGSCQSGAPVVCTALDQCHDAGTCDPTTGCSNPAKADGTACNDGSLCTTGDSCQSGSCTAGSAVVCSAQDQCHDAGTCNPTTGLCSNPAKPNGASCNDGSACTQTDTCQAGTCTGANPVVCTAVDQCHDAGTCDPATGACSNPGKADGTACNDGDQCTVDETCAAGICAGSTVADADEDGVCDVRDVCPAIPNPDQLDSDQNGVGDACECTQQAPGRCIMGGGNKTTDCLVEVNPTAPASPNPRRTGILGVLRCTDGDPACDFDRLADGKCTFGVAICVANHDPRLAKCQAAGMQSFEVMSPNPDRTRSSMDRDNGLALEQGLGNLGLEIRRRGRVLAAGGTPPGGSLCSSLIRLVTPAPTGAKPVRRTFQLRGVSTDRRIDTDRVSLECRR